MTPIKQRAEEAAREVERSSSWRWTPSMMDVLTNIIERALAAQQAEHEAERDAAVAEALERAAQRINYAFDHELSIMHGKERTHLVTAIRALAPRSDLVCVPVKSLLALRKALIALADAEADKEGK